jgi:hypothetical protein
MMMFRQSGVLPFTAQRLHGEPSASSAFAMRFEILSGCVTLVWRSNAPKL